MSQVATMQDLQTKVKERINSVFMELVPPELMDQLIQKALEDWQRVELPKLVKEIVENKYKEGISELITTSWDYHTKRHQPTDAMKVIINQCIPSLVNEMFTTAVMNGVAKMQSRGY